MLKNFTLLCLLIISIATLTGCVSMGISKMEPDPAVSNMTLSERYQKYHKESLGIVDGKTVVDNQGNTITHEDLKAFFKDKKDMEALKKVSTGYLRRTAGVLGGLLVAGILTAECFHLADTVPRSVEFEAIYPYGLFALASVEFSVLIPFFGERMDTREAVGIYNLHLRQRIGISENYTQ